MWTHLANTGTVGNDVVVRRVKPAEIKDSNTKTPNVQGHQDPPIAPSRTPERPLGPNESLLFLHEVRASLYCI